ncbi:MAG: sulfite exporter TauE/SafE family protein [Hyphomicrobiales bacterium]|nr:sulfite exporter TauE/SafE family protein [Hyphomicrobiales bacterium]
MLRPGLDLTMDLSPEAWALIAAAVLLGAFVKGVFGIGFPLVAVPLMAVVGGVPLAVSLIAVPVVAANLVQVHLARLRRVGARFWVLILCLAPGTWLGTKLLLLLEPRELVIIMGLSVIVFTGLQLSRYRLRIRPAAEPWIAPVAGFASGVLGGLTAFFGAPLMVFLLSIELERERFVGLVGLIYLFCGFFLIGSLFMRGLLDLETVLAGLALCVPMALGMAGGAQIRRRIPPETFFRSVLVLLMLVGIGMVGRAL